MTRSHKNRGGLQRLVRATGYSMAGLAAAYRAEAAFRQEVWLAVVLVPAAFWVGRSWVEVSLLIGAVGLVLIVELLNSSIEATIDRVSAELHDLSRNAKDIASAAVMVSVLLCLGVWLAALWQRIAG